MCLSLSRRQPLYQLLSPNASQHPPTEGLHPPPCSSSSPHAASASPSNPRGCFRGTGLGPSKKRVMFADAVGLALTAVRLFIPDPASFDSPVTKTSVDLLPAQAWDQQATSNQQQRHRSRLGLAQPLSDFKAPLAHQETSIQLESCELSENSLIGKVCVSRGGVKKTVWIRLTFDSWRSFRDYPCTFLRPLSFAVDVYAFDLCLPKSMGPDERAEFCVFFKAGPGSTPQWDDNRGKNYSMHLETDMRQGRGNLCRSASLRQRPTAWPSSELQNPYYCSTGVRQQV